MKTTHIPALLISTAPVAFASQPPSDGVFPTDQFEKRSKDSAAMLPHWEKTEAIIDGIEGLRAQGDKFLPKFRDEESADFAYRLKCSKVTNVYRDIVEGLSAKPFEQPVSLVADETTATGDTDDDGIPAEIKKFIWDVDGSGNNLTVFAAHTFYQGVNSAIDWIMVDYSKPNSAVRNRRDAQRAGMRPYWSHILARNVLDVQSKVVGGEETLTYMKIMEPGDPNCIREFTRSDEGVVTWKLYEQQSSGTSGKTEYVVVDSGDIKPLKRIPLVPFVTGRRDGRRWFFHPALRDAADLQIELFQQESGLKFAKTLTAYPMLAANGIAQPKGQDGKPAAKIAVGPNRVLFSPPDEMGNKGEWKYLEPSSESLKFLADDITNTIQQLRELGRQPLTAQSGNITVITAAVAAGKAKSTVKAWTFVLKDALENALSMSAQYMNVDYDPTVLVHSDFDDWMDGDDLESLDKSRERGDLSQETYWEEQQRRGVLSSNFTATRERARLLNEIPGDGPDVEIEE